MTPKEKAKELVYKFSQVIPPSKYEAYEDGVKIDFDYENAKQCALITVDEILEVINETMVLVDIESDYDYWQEVKIDLT